MRKSKSYTSHIPRIIKINAVSASRNQLAVLYDNGENRILDFKRIITEEWKSGSKSLEYQLLDTTLFKSVYLLDGNLYWSKLHVEYTFKKKKQIVDFSIGADVLYGLSELDNQRTLRIGKLFRTWRTALNLTQEEVARRAGTSRTYITKLEAGNADVELKTLIRLVQAGLNKELEIRLK